MHARRVSATPHLGGSPFLGTLYMVHTSCVSNTPLPGWGISPSADGGNGPLARRAHKRVDTYGFHPLANHPFPFVLKSVHGTALPFLFVLGTEKGERQYRYWLVGSA